MAKRIFKSSRRGRTALPELRTRQCKFTGCNSTLNKAGKYFTRSRGHYQVLKCKAQSHFHWQGADGILHLSPAGRGHGRTRLSLERPRCPDCGEPMKISGFSPIADDCRYWRCGLCERKATRRMRGGRRWQLVRGELARTAPSRPKDLGIDRSCPECRTKGAAVQLRQIAKAKSGTLSLKCGRCGASRVLDPGADALRLPNRNARKHIAGLDSRACPSCKDGTLQIGLRKYELAKLNCSKCRYSCWWDTAAGSEAVVSRRPKRERQYGMKKTSGRPPKSGLWVRAQAYKKEGLTKYKMAPLLYPDVPQETAYSATKSLFKRHR